LSDNPHYDRGPIAGRGSTNYDLEDPNPSLNGYDIWMGWATFDTVDERGTPGKLIGLFENKNDAVLASQGQGWYGGDGRVHQQQFIRIRHTGEVFALKDPCPVRFGNTAELMEKKRKAALAKLTPEERRLLGVKE
jgi:hypothetical protein